jgi:hypothetical protein
MNYNTNNPQMAMGLLNDPNLMRKMPMQGHNQMPQNSFGNITVKMPNNN